MCVGGGVRGGAFLRASVNLKTDAFKNGAAQLNLLQLLPQEISGPNASTIPTASWKLVRQPERNGNKTKFLPRSMTLADYHPGQKFVENITKSKT